jgi:Family of unknown function (DUF5709)
MTDDPADYANGVDADLEDDGVLDPADTLEGNLSDDDVDQALDAPDRWSAGERYGTTLDEERAGESLDQQLAQEEPDIDADAYADAGSSSSYQVDLEAGPLVTDDDDVRGDEEPDLVAHAAGEPSGGGSAEEAAVHVVDDPDRDTGPLADDPV